MCTIAYTPDEIGRYAISLLSLTVNFRQTFGFFGNLIRSQEPGWSMIAVFLFFFRFLNKKVAKTIVANDFSLFPHHSLTPRSHDDDDYDCNRRGCGTKSCLQSI